LTTSEAKETERDWGRLTLTMVVILDRWSTALGRDKGLGTRKRSLLDCIGQNKQEETILESPKDQKKESVVVKRESERHVGKKQEMGERE
jgi:hypothetical protein